MNKNPKIVVFKLKELIYTGIFILSGILLIILFVWMFRSGKTRATATSSVPETTASIEERITGKVSEEETTTDNMAAQPSSENYHAGVYTSSLMLNNSALEIEVRVSPDRITSISIKNMDEGIKTMYPLIENSVKDLEKQILSSQSLKNITYTDDCRYTYLILIDAISSALSKAI